ncbi:YbaK/EbsC family protein [archaeon]|nr:YbaK/EbsC family protein [archaeon]
MNVYYDGGPLCRDVLPSPFPEVDRSLNHNCASLDTAWPISSQDLRSNFFNENQLEYVLDTLVGGGEDLRLVSHPTATITCEEKAKLLGWDKSRIIKAVYFVHKDSEKLYGVIVPDLGSVDLKSLSDILGFNAKKKLRLAHEGQLVGGMKFGTCNPFIPLNCGNVAGIIFDENLVEQRRAQGGFDDFSIALGLEKIPDNQISVQMNYAIAFDLLKRKFPEKVMAANVKYNSSQSEV